MSEVVDGVAFWGPAEKLRAVMNGLTEGTQARMFQHEDDGWILLARSTPRPIDDSLSDLRISKVTGPEWRLQAIAQAHVKEVDAHGGTWGDCAECGHAWPCPTYAWATTKREFILDCWDPADDEKADES